MLLDIMNGTYLDSFSIRAGAGLDASVFDSFALYPGTYEEKWGVDKTAMLEKVRKLDDWQVACLAIWAVDFWASDIYEQPDSITRYVTGKAGVPQLGASALEHLARAVELQEKTRGAFKSALIAEARTETEKALAILKELL